MQRRRIKQTHTMIDATTHLASIYKANKVRFSIFVTKHLPKITVELIVVLTEMISELFESDVPFFLLFHFCQL